MKEHQPNITPIPQPVNTHPRRLPLGGVWGAAAEMPRRGAESQSPPLGIIYKVK